MGKRPSRAVFVSRGLPRTEGWNGAAAFDEGRWGRKVKWKPNRLQFDLQVKTTTRHSSGGTPLGKPPRFVVARSAKRDCGRPSTCEQERGRAQRNPVSGAITFFTHAAVFVVYLL